MARDRVTVQEAARRLGVKDDAIRKRIQRGTLDHDKGPDGRVYVYLEPFSAASGDTQGRDADREVSYDEFLAGLQDQVRYLRSVLKEERDARKRADTIIAELTQTNAALAQRVSQVQAPQMHRETATGEHEEGDSGDPRDPVRPRDTAEFPVRGSLSRPWWRRAFGG